jgi:hypothetical protein
VKLRNKIHHLMIFLKDSLSKCILNNENVYLAECSNINTSTLVRAATDIPRDMEHALS